MVLNRHQSGPGRLEFRVVMVLICIMIKIIWMVLEGVIWAVLHAPVQNEWREFRWMVLEALSWHIQTLVHSFSGD